MTDKKPEPKSLDKAVYIPPALHATVTKMAAERGIATGKLAAMLIERSLPQLGSIEMIWFSSPADYE